MRAGKRKDFSHGFTLIELLVTVALIAIIATIAVPSFQGLLARNQFSSDFNQILIGVNYGRSEAAKRREKITVSVSPGDNGRGWLLEIKVNDGSSLSEIDCFNSLGPDEGCLQVRDARDSPISIGNSVFSVTFDQLGRRANTSGIVTLSHAAINKSEAICVGPAGMILVGGDCE